MGSQDAGKRTGHEAAATRGVETGGEEVHIPINAQKAGLVSGAGRLITVSAAWCGIGGKLKG